MYLYSKTFLLWVLVLNVGSGHGFSHFDYNHLLNLQAVNQLDIEDVKYMKIYQPLDHFNIYDTRKWPMRYLESRKFFVPGGPIILFVGGESPVNPYWAKYGLAANFAQEVRGALFLSEHRFYGESIPNGDLSVENLAYLSSAQALADLRNLIYLVKSQSEFRYSKVVVFGGSYPGNLATWLRALYPDVVDAAWASSAPVLAKIDFFENLEVVGEALRKYGPPDCYDKVAKKFQRYEQLMTTPQGIELLKKEENICERVDMSILENQQTFFFNKIVPYSNQTQVTSPGQIRLNCFKESLGLDILNVRSALWNDVSNCYDSDFNKLVDNLKSNPSFRPWMYQTCTEFGFMMTTSSVKQPFTQNIPIDFYYKSCMAAFGPAFGKERMEKGVKSTNDRYGGLKPNVQKVVFINGDMDPWHRLGVLEDLSSEAPARVIENASHCSDLNGSTPGGAAIIEFAKRQIKKWIGLPL